MLQLLLDVRGVQDHGVLNGKAAPRGKDLLVVRCAVLARVGDAPVLHGLFCFGQIPALGLGAGERDTVQRVQMQDQVHHRGGDEIEVVQRLTQYGHVGRQVVHLGGIFRYNEKF